MIEDKDRSSLINYRIEQAKETISTAKFLLDANKLSIAVNRIYYGMYYALTALALKNQFETSKHVQLIGWFNKEFISTKKIDTRYGKILRNAFQSRMKGDYDAFVNFEKSEVEQMIIEMKDFVSTIESIL